MKKNDNRYTQNNKTINKWRERFLSYDTGEEDIEKK